MAAMVCKRELKHDAILDNGTEVFNLPITNLNGSPILSFDWLIHSGLILARIELPENSGERTGVILFLF